MSIFKKRKQRGPIYEAHSYDAEAHQTEMPFTFEHPDCPWTTKGYTIPEDFLKFYAVGFQNCAESMLASIDEGIPGYMDQVVYDASAEALAILKRIHATRVESINDIIVRKKVSVNDLSRELEEINKETEKVEKMIEIIGGTDYENC